MNIIGIWKSDPEDKNTQKEFGDIIVEFRDKEKIIYTINTNDKKEIILLTYRIDGNKIITDQFSSPRKEITYFVLTDTHLELNFNGVKSRFIRD